MLSSGQLQIREATFITSLEDSLSATLSKSASAVEGRTNGAPYSRIYVWYVTLLLTLVYALNFLDRMALAVLAPLVKADLHLSDAQLGLMVGLAFSLFFAICGIPIARWADRGTRRNIVALALAAWSAMTALSGLAQNAWQLFLARVGVGIGEAGCVPPSHSLLCDYVPLKQRAGTFAVYTFGVYAGMMLGMALAGTLGEAIGWRWTFIVLGLPGLVLAIVVKLTLSEPARGSFDGLTTRETHSLFGQTLRTLWRCKSYGLIALFMICNGFVQLGLNQWWPSFYTRTYGLGLSTVGVYLGVAIGVGSGTGLLLGGLLANKIGQRDVRLPLVFGAVATGLALPAGIASLFVASFHASIGLVGLTTLLWSIAHGPLTGALYSVTAPGMRATAGALALFAIAVLGYSLGPLCVGALSDGLAPTLGVESLRYALLAPIGLLPGMAVLLYVIARGLLADLHVAEAPVEGTAVGA